MPAHHVLDNECSKDFKQAIKENNMTYQLADAHDHRWNIAEKAIQNFKDHFLSILCRAYDSFPMYLWDQLLEQAEHQLNMLRPSRVVPTISSYTHLYGTHGYNIHPFAPLTCKIQVHEMPGTRKSWDVHTVTGWYLGCHGNTIGITGDGFKKQEAREQAQRYSSSTSTWPCSQSH